MFVFVPSQEKQRAQADLLHVHANEDMLHSLWIEETTGIRGRRLLISIKEEILVQLIEHEKCRACKTVDDR